MFLRFIDPHANLSAWSGFLALVRQRGELIAALTWRDLADRYSGQALGASWAFISPLLTMITYLFAFGLVFKGRIGATDTGAAYIAFMLAGLAPWITLQDCLGRASMAIRNSANLVKQIVFPSEVLPLRVALSSLPTLAIGLLVTIPVCIMSGGWTLFGLMVLLPLAALFMTVMFIGLAFWLAAIGVFVRDVKDLVQFFLGIGLFLHPVLYPPAFVPEWLKPWFAVSPFSHMIWCFRDALTEAEPIHLASWFIFPAFAIIVFTSGWRVFRMLKPSFGNLL